MSTPQQDLKALKWNEGKALTEKLHPKTWQYVVFQIS